MIYLSISDYTRSLRCPKIIWLDKHRPNLAKAAIEEDSLPNIYLEEGRKAGKMARSYFGEYALVRRQQADGDEDIEPMAAETRRLLKAARAGKGPRVICGANVVCEASFGKTSGIRGGQPVSLFCGVDILLYKDKGLELVEVNSSTSVKPEHLDDLAYKYYIANLAAGLAPDKGGHPVRKAFLLHIDSGYERQGPLELDKLFSLVDCTKEALKRQTDIAANVQKIAQTVSARKEPEYPIDHCCPDGEDCPYFTYCYPDGIVTDDINEPDVGGENEAPRVDRKALRNYFVDIGFRWPVYHLDFETFQEAVPSLDRQRPWQQIPFQYSLHIQTGPADTDPEHREFLAGTVIGDDCPQGDPRRALAERLCADIPDDAFVMAYFMSFERGRIKDLAALFPDLSRHLLRIHDNIRDLIVPFRQGAWHSPAQDSNSLKAVLPAMFPDNPSLDYEALDLVHDGSEASAAYLALHTQSPEEQERTRAALLKYCRLDTFAMVKILTELVRLASPKKTSPKKASPKQ